MEFSSDIFIVGAGTAGCIAAIQAASMGLSTLLMDINGIPGGTMTSGRVNYPGLFHANGKHIIKGIGWQLVSDAVSFNNDNLPDFSKSYMKSHSEHQIQINSDIYALLLEEKLLKSNVSLHYYEMPIKVEYIKDQWIIDCAGLQGVNRYRSSQIIDCTGDAGTIALAGFGRNRGNATQPGTIMFKFEGYNTNSLNYELLQKKYTEEVESGKLEKNIFNQNIKSLLISAHIDNKKFIFTNHILNADSSSSKNRTLTNIDGRKALLTFLRFIKTLPGLENTTIAYMSEETSIRETYRIDAEYNLSVQDYINGKHFSDSVCYSYYPIDIHDKDGVKPIRLKTGIIPEVPLRALIPKNSKNIITAGRCIGSDREANSAVRVQATCMATGQVAGAASAIAAKSGTTPGKVPIDELRSILREYDAIVPKTD